MWYPFKNKSIPRKIALGYAVILGSAAALNYAPGITDHHGRAFGIFALDLWDDLLHLGSALWALTAALVSRKTALAYLKWFGAIYLGDGLLGLATGVGYLDLGIFLHGPQDYDIVFRMLANAPHISLGGFAVFSALKWRG
jgi:hypothetical protein